MPPTLRDAVEPSEQSGDFRVRADAEVGQVEAPECLLQSVACRDGLGDAFGRR
jgi:hypothetical protein